MKRHLTFLLIGMMMGTNLLADSYDPLNPPRLIAFKKKIGFDEARAKEKNQYVDIDLKKLKLPPELTSWKLVKDETTTRDEVSIHTLKFQDGKKIVTIVANIFKPAKKKEAADLFLMDVNNTTMMDIFYIPSPIPVGTASVVDKQQPPSKGLFLYLNVHTQIFSPGTDNSLFTFAKWLQAEFEKNLKPAS